ncbi:hypothetical protein SAY87_023828 [Trapa incisa]|uniref:VQ domain-containing protein n=1 Tax=Trapa incisa TaxID=236973 RepID=A0AAN7L7G0_9MYRT|nr:hypothetical protein SAY87_023828 [Trapa incisa]
MSELSESLHGQYHANSYNIHQIKPAKSLMKKKPPKVTYISSPVMVTAATASEFQSIVQELTGKDSGTGTGVPPLTHCDRHGGPMPITLFSREKGGTTGLFHYDHDSGSSTADFPPMWQPLKDSHAEAASDGFLDGSLAVHHHLPSFYEPFSCQELPDWPATVSK